MGLIRLLIIAALIYLAWRVVKNLLSQASGRDNSSPDRSSQDTQAMLKCAQCGVHVPAPEAFTHNGHHFCCQEHQRLYLEHHDR
ncbi:PP0621 family protein [Alcanivorax jadensis]|uniref:PP0621 family protein n=1 Tax=Alcanivorax jadensis TaxID=64988 RepID=UPI0026F2B723|nr:PP0621 family protein [Alcanivorax jadensis]